MIVGANSIDFSLFVADFEISRSVSFSVPNGHLTEKRKTERALAATTHSAVYEHTRIWPAQNRTHVLFIEAGCEVTHLKMSGSVPKMRRFVYTSSFLLAFVAVSRSRTCSVSLVVLTFVLVVVTATARETPDIRHGGRQLDSSNRSACDVTARVQSVTKNLVARPRRTGKCSTSSKKTKMTM